MIISKRNGASCFHQKWCPYVKKIGTEYRRNVSRAEASRRGYHECSLCGGMRTVYMQLEEDPEHYGKNGSRLGLFFDKKDLALCLRSEIGFWKILKNKQTGKYVLYHLNTRNFSQNVEDRFLARRLFHRQSDVKETESMNFILDYVYEHDKAKKFMFNNDYRNLPKKTKKQKKYYKKARKMQIRKEINRVNDIFAQLERKENLKNGRSSQNLCADKQKRSG